MRNNWLFSQFCDNNIGIFLLFLVKLPIFVSSLLLLLIDLSRVVAIEIMRDQRLLLRAIAIKKAIQKYSHKPKNQYEQTCNKIKSNFAIAKLEER